MKNKKMLTLFAVTMLAAVSVPSVSLAAPVGDIQSNGRVSFQADKSATDPKNPLDPGEKKPGTPLDPIDPNGKATPGTNGPLSLDFVSSFSFGEASITSDDATYFAKAQSFTQEDGTVAERPNFVQVSDKRGTFEGWTLKVKQDKQFSVIDDATKELEGAELSFLNASTASTVDSKYAPDGQSEFTLTPGSSQIAPLTAAKDKGMGTWIYRLGDEATKEKSVALSVPGKTPKMAKEYTTSLTWSLETTPTNP